MSSLDVELASPHRPADDTPPPADPVHRLTAQVMRLTMLVHELAAEVSRLKRNEIAELTARLPRRGVERWLLAGILVVLVAMLVGGGVAFVRLSAFLAAIAERSL